MKKYHVYGIGNALVDMEFEVTEQWLSDNAVTKGIMTLVDQKRQDELTKALDVFKARKCCGGSAANTIIAVSQYGGDSYYSCKVSNDEIGDFYYSDLKNEGVSTNLGDQRPDGVTGKCLVLVTPDADRTMNTYLGITETIGESELKEDELLNSDYLYIEGYLVSSATGKKAAIKARKFAQSNGIKTALTFSDPAMVNFFRDGLIEMLGNTPVDLLFCNEEEAREFTDMPDLNDAIDVLKKFAHNFAITVGPKGALVYERETDTLHEIPTKEVTPIDTNGAGDLFAGSFLYALTHGRNFQDAGRLACAASSELVTKFGARLSKDEIQDIKRQELS